MIKLRAFIFCNPFFQIGFSFFRHWICSKWNSSNRIFGSFFFQKCVFSQWNLLALMICVGFFLHTHRMFDNAWKMCMWPISKNIIWIYKNANCLRTCLCALTWTCLIANVTIYYVTNHSYIEQIMWTHISLHKRSIVYVMFVCDYIYASVWLYLFSKTHNLKKNFCLWVGLSIC